MRSIRFNVEVVAMVNWVFLDAIRVLAVFRFIVLPILHIRIGLFSTSGPVQIQSFGETGHGDEEEEGKQSWGDEHDNDNMINHFNVATEGVPGPIYKRLQPTNQPTFHWFKT